MFKFNKIIWILISSDIMFNGAAGILSPVFAIFLVQSIDNGSARLAGSAVALYWLVKSTLRIPIAYYLDKNQGEWDDFYSLVIGFFIWSITHFLYIFASMPWHIYLIQTLMAVGGAFAFTPWYGFFTRHIDKHHENFEWSISVSLTGYGMALAGFMGGYLSDSFGFKWVFISTGVISLIGVVLLLLLKKEIIKNSAQKS